MVMFWTITLKFLRLTICFILPALSSAKGKYFCFLLSLVCSCKLTSVEPNLFFVVLPLISYVIIRLEFLKMCGYALPSSTAILHKDKDAYRQSVAFWLIMFLWPLFDPLLTLALHPLVKLALLLWLSLPRYQGASIVYAVAIRPLFVKYEKHVEQKLNFAMALAKRIMIKFFIGTGWSMILQMKLAVLQLTLHAQELQQEETQPRIIEKVEPTEESPQLINS